MEKIVQPLLKWFETHQRELPWRKDRQPYHVWVSEIMLQQTRIEAVKKYYARFMEELPDVESLSLVSEDRLLKLWEGLGYYSRAKNLKKAAQMIMEEYNGEFPDSYEKIIKLSGIGEYTAGAIASIVQYALRAADSAGNRVHGISEPSSQTPEHDLMTRFKSGTLDSPMRLCTITGIRLGDGDFGISPGEGEVCLTLRAEIEEEMLAMEQSIISFARQVAAAAGLQMTYSSHDYFPETCNHDDCLDRVLYAAQENKIPAMSMRELWRASEDFGHYLKICPGAMFYIGNGEDYPPLHTAEYDFNDRIIETAVNMFMRIAGIPV